MSENTAFLAIVINYVFTSLAFLSFYSSLQKANQISITTLALKSPKKRKTLELEGKRLQIKKRLFLLWPVILLLDMKDEFSNK